MQASRRRALRAIERDLAASDARLARLFSFFGLLHRAEKMPRTEKLRRRPLPSRDRIGRLRGSLRDRWSAAWPALLLGVTLAGGACAIAVAGPERASPACAPPGAQRIAARQPARCTGGSPWPYGR